MTRSPAALVQSGLARATASERQPPERSRRRCSELASGEVATVFANREAAGRELAERLRHLAGQDLVVLGLSRGGVPVAYQVARALGAALDVIVVRKVGVPFQPELAMGAVGEGGIRVVNEQVCEAAWIGPDEFAAAAAREQAEVDRRARRFRAGRPPVPMAGRVAVVVDDGIATGSTARAACQVARAHGAARVVLAVPVAPRDTPELMRDVADDVVCLRRPTTLLSVGRWYMDFDQTSDAEVVTLLEEAGRERQLVAAPAGAADPPGTERRDPPDPPARDEEITVPVGGVRLAGRLAVPDGASGLVVFAHGSGSSRHSPRNRYVATVLNDAGLATLLFDLLTPAEEPQRARVFDVELLADRLSEVTRQVRPAFGWVGYFGASTGSAAALWAAAEPDADIAAVVSRGGRPDLAAPRLAAVHAPTPADRRRLRPDRAGAQPAGAGRDGRPCRAGRGPRRHPPVRGTRQAGGCGRTGPGLVPSPRRPTTIQ